MPIFSLLALLAASLQLRAANFDCSQLVLPPPGPATYSKSPTADFALRDKLPRTHIPRDGWFSYTSWGPCVNPYPKVVFPESADRLHWSRERLVAAAKKLIGTPYRHFHIPELGGIDCSNFTALIYNYAFGIRFTSNVGDQAERAGRRLEPDEPLEPGDLIYLWSKERDRISHVVMYLNQTEYIDATPPDVQIRQFNEEQRQRTAWVRRILE